ncbi:MAG TPA: hypothetical protein VEI01_24030 [Terriglobales bacterium]|nr:hypothetical protein [Terriglobales bacterium]
MITVRRSGERGGGDHGWLNTKHTFRLGDYWDPRWMGFRSLRVMNEKKGLEPSYEQKSFPAKEKQGKLRLVASRDGRDGSVRINQDAQLYVTLLRPGEKVMTELGDGRYGWLQVPKGAVELNRLKLGQGDGAATSDEKGLAIRASEPSELLFFNLG